MGAPEYLPFSVAGTLLTRCLSCGAILSMLDTNIHSDWHAKVEG